MKLLAALLLIGATSAPALAGPRTGYRSQGGYACLLYTSPSPRDVEETRMPSSA